MLPAVIDAGRLRLRPFLADDLEPLLAYASAESYLRYLPIPLPYTRASAEEFLAKQVLLDRELNPSWAIEVEGESCGGVNIRFFAGHRGSEIGYAVAPSRWGQGLATAAARAVIAAAFSGYSQLGRVRATADPRNAGSIRVMEKLGMRREGLLRSERVCRDELTDVIIYGLLRAEWRV